MAVLRIIRRYENGTAYSDVQFIQNWIVTLLFSVFTQMILLHDNKPLNMLFSLTDSQHKT